MGFDFLGFGWPTQPIAVGFLEIKLMKERITPSA
jgi:hypothetical protein